MSASSAEMLAQPRERQLQPFFDTTGGARAPLDISNTQDSDVCASKTIYVSLPRNQRAQAAVPILLC